LNDIAGLIADRGELHIFSHWNKEELNKYEHLQKEHVIYHGLLDPSQLMTMMNEEMDVAIMLNSFMHEELFKYNFSSKLVDYTSAGLPVLIWGPASSGAVSWALEEGYEAVSTERDPGVKIATLLEQFHDHQTRSLWAKKIKELGSEQFSYDKNYTIFLSEVCKAAS